MILVAGGSFTLCSGSAFAVPLVPKMNSPESYHDLRFGLDEMRQNINSVSCGGWHDDPQSGGASSTSAWGEMPYPFISHDVPGRDNLMPAMSKATTGLDAKTNFEFPDSAFGYLSACNMYDGKKFDPDLKKMGLNLVYDDVPVDGDPNPRLEGGDGFIDINPYHWCVRFDKATPRWCEKLFNTWKRMAQIAPRPWSDEFCKCPFQPPAPDAFCQYVPEGPPKQYCFDYGAVAPHQDATEPDGRPMVIESADYTKECNGQECRTPWQPLYANALIKCEDWEPQFDADGNYIGHIPKKVYDGYNYPGQTSSFYRHYGNPFSDWSQTKQAGQTPLTVTVPTFEWKVRADCYEYYQAHLDYPVNQWKELDPEQYVTSPYDEQCEFTILTNDEQSPEPPEWKNGGPNGEVQKDVVKAPWYDVQEPGREPRSVIEPWVADPDTNLSLIDMQKLRDKQKKFDDPSDITSILSTILMARNRGSKTVPGNARSDQFDDSDHRALSSFWEAQQRELLKMTADPQTRLIMPARFLVGIAEDDPLFQYVTHVVTRADGTVEITLRAGAEDLENVLKSFMRIFVSPIQEVRIPVLVPLASASEIDALISQWQQWKHAEELEGRAGNGALADPLIAKLQGYRDRIASIRKSRNGLTQLLTRLYDGQEKIRTYFAEWFKEQSDLFLLAIQRAEQRRSLKRTWRLLQRSMLQTDACQTYYCSNQRYSIPIYSLLDNWWGPPSILPGQMRDPNYIPPYDLRTVGFVQPPDQVFDFSKMTFSRTPLLIPVLYPVSVKMALPTRPEIGGTPPDPAKYLDLPPVPDETMFDSFPVPDVDLTQKPTISFPTGMDLSSAQDKLREVRKIIDGTDPGAQIAEEGALAMGGEIDDGGFPPGGLQPNRYSMRSAYCRFQPSILRTPDPEQGHGYEAKIIHTEYDLKDRIARLFARWMPERTEDMAGRVARVNQDYPNNRKPPPDCREDDVCYRMPPEITKETIWKWFMPDSASAPFNGLASQMRSNSLPPDDAHSPYINAPVFILKRVFSDIPLPPTFDLSIPPPPAP